MSTGHMSLVDLIVEELRRHPEKADEIRAVLKDTGDERLLTTSEAADVLGVHPDTLTRAAREGRCRGAQRAGVKLWRFRSSELEILPTRRPDITAVGNGNPTRRLGRSPVASAIAGTA
jgi:excisionase family DNA binding protein